MILSPEDTLYAYGKIKEAYGSINRIDDFFRMKKIERIKEIPPTLFGMSHEDDLFQDFSMHPEDMNFRIVQPDHSKFNTLLEMTASFTYEEAPGKEFGFNYLGGKLLSLICCSHEVREMLNKKYNTEMCLFETTSLYGNIKGTSQYDGLKPYLRYRGDTESKFLLTLPDFIYHDLSKWFVEKNGGPLIHKGASSRKLKIQTKMISIIKNSLKEYYPDLYTDFVAFIKSKQDVTTQKRFYMSDYGYENAKDVILGKTETLIPNKQNFDKFYLENMVQWWKRKASNRYQKLVSEGSLRNDLEVWNSNTMNTIDIIR